MDSPAWRCEHVPSADSTQDLVLARNLEQAGLVIWTTDQRAGRGRADRHWISPANSGIAMSLLLKPSRERTSWTWYPLLLSCAASLAIADRGVQSCVKWPNDVMVGERKIAGVLATVSGDSLVVGIGINTAMSAQQAPEPRATSLAMEGASQLDALSLVDDVLRHFTELLAESNPASTYRKHCATIGRDVVVHTPAGVITGVARDIDDAGALIVKSGHDLVALTVGDVTHVR